MSRVACIGECMVELRQTQGGHYSRGFGGDTLNTAVYLARLGVQVDYLTALGDDGLSEGMIAGWVAEGVGARIVHLPGKLPGLYLIQTDAKGERQVFHWCEDSAARHLMELPETEDVLNSLATYDVVYLSAITLSIYDQSGRDRLMTALSRARLLGTRVAFDTNFRARGWPDLEIARSVFGAAFETADIVLGSVGDLSALYPGESPAALMTRIPSPEVVLRLAESACLLRFPGGSSEVEVRAEPATRPVVDTTAAGDSFAAAYLAARVTGAEPVEAAHAGHRLASVVVCYHGAIVPHYAMPPKKWHRPPHSHKPAP